MSALTAGCPATVYCGQLTPELCEVPADGTEVELTDEAQGYCVEAKINGKGPFRFLVDTGHSAPLGLSRTVVDQLQLPILPLVSVEGIDAFGASSTLQVAWVDEFELGGATVRGLPVLIEDGLFICPRETPTDGTVGYPLLGVNWVSLDPQHSRMRIEPDMPTAGDLKVILDASSPPLEPNVPVQVGSAEFSLLVDSGYSFSLSIDQQTAAGLNFCRDLVQDFPTVSWQSTLAGRLGLLSDTVRIGSQTFDGLPIQVQASSMTLGRGILDQFVFQYSADGRRCRLLAADDDPVTYGSLTAWAWTAELQDGIWRVVWVSTGSVAEQLGMQAGDEIVTMEGLPAAELTEETLWCDFLGRDELTVRLRSTEREIEVTVPIRLRYSCPAADSPTAREIMYKALPFHR